MPPSTETAERQSGRLLTPLFWAGVGLAPIAALFLLVGSGDGSLRAAVGIALLSIILMGLSLALRPQPESIKVELEDTIFDEIDILREDVRADITTAARATHRQFGEKFQYLQDNVEHMRGQLEAIRAELARAQQHAPVHHPAPQPQQHAGPPPVARPSGPPIVPGGPGIVRHTETVQVTTRSTIVDPHAEDARRTAARGSEWGTRQPQPSRAEHEESWTEQRLRERLTGAGREREVDGEVVAPRDRFEGERDGEDRWAGMRSGDRWASVRSDDRGREMRVGERRAAVHSDESGTEMRIEDRWAAVRRDEARRDEPRRAADDRWEEPRPRRPAPEDADWDSRDDERGYSRRALPASQDEPSAGEWVRGWSHEPEPERERRRYDY